MAIYNLGSINTDHFYRLPHLPGPGETLAAVGYERGLGGKGANQSVAASRAGALVRHIGAIGADGAWMSQRMRDAGVDCTHVAVLPGASGHAIILIEAGGENSIVLHPGANRAIDSEQLRAALAGAGGGDFLMLQNETSGQIEAARIARDQGLFVVYSAAPFEAGAVQAILTLVDLLLLNEVEAAQYHAATGQNIRQAGVGTVVITKGAKGADWHDRAGSETIHMPAFATEVVDTTGAGDTFAGYLVAALAEGAAPAQAMRLAAAAAALKVQRAGTADAIPARADVEAFLSVQPSE